MKKITAILMAIILFAALLVGCKTTETGSKAEESSTESEERISELDDTGLAEYWKLSDGGNASGVSSANGGTAGEQKWGVWLKTETFGLTLDFSTAGSFFSAKVSKADLTGDFTVSLWMLAPVRENEDRVLLYEGNEESSNMLYLDAQADFALTYEATGVSGVEGSGVSLADGKWHHVMVTRAGDTLTYFVDGEAVKSCSVSGKASCAQSDLYLGAKPDGSLGFDGSMAEVKIYTVAKEKAAQTTDLVLNESDNEAKAPRMDMKKGIVIDRRQYFKPEPLENEGQTVREQDIINCKNMGFDHVKLLLTPNHLMDDEGHLIQANLYYIESVLQYVKDNDFRCILCIHPEGDFKTKYLGDLENFEKLVNWYGEFAAYIGKWWDADMMSIQLMTEPNGNTDEVSWDWISDRMWGAVRNALPDHTILTSSDDFGNMERLKLMSPATDSNLIYTFTTYEPYTIGFYAYSTNYGVMTGWSYVHDIPYPVEEGVDYTEAIENAIDKVPAEFKDQVRQDLTDYVNGTRDLWRENAYDCLYNAEWHELRAKSLDDWSKKYGGNIHIMCVEFGCMDAATPAKLWKTAAEGFGIDPDTRIQFVYDMRTAFDKYGIGWSYWSYNEAHTIFELDKHVYGESPTPEEAINMIDYDMLEHGLGVTPLIGKE